MMQVNDAVKVTNGALSGAVGTLESLGDSQGMVRISGNHNGASIDGVFPIHRNDMEPLVKTAAPVTGTDTGGEVQAAAPVTGTDTGGEEQKAAPEPEPEPDYGNPYQEIVDMLKGIVDGQEEKRLWHSCVSAGIHAGNELQDAIWKADKALDHFRARWL